MAPNDSRSSSRPLFLFNIRVPAYLREIRTESFESQPHSQSTTPWSPQSIPDTISVPLRTAFPESTWLRTELPSSRLQISESAVMLLPRQDNFGAPSFDAPDGSPAIASETPSSFAAESSIEPQDPSPIRNGISSTRIFRPTQTNDGSEPTSSAEEAVVTETITPSNSVDLPSHTSAPSTTQPTSSPQPSASSGAADSTPFRLGPSGIAATTLLLTFVVVGLGVMLWWYRRRIKALASDQESRNSDSTLGKDFTSTSKLVDQDQPSRVSLRESMMFQSDRQSSRPSSSGTSLIRSPRSSRHTSLRSEGFEMQQRRYSPSISNPYNPHGPGLAISDFTPGDDPGSSPISPLIPPSEYHNQYHASQSSLPYNHSAPPSRRSQNSLPSPSISQSEPYSYQSPPNWPLLSSTSHSYAPPQYMSEDQAGQGSTSQSQGDIGRQRLSFEEVPLQR